MAVSPSPHAAQFQKWRWAFLMIGPLLAAYFFFSIFEAQRNPSFPTVGSAARTASGQLGVTLVSRGDGTDNVLIYVQQSGETVCLYDLYSEQRIDRRLTLDCPALTDAPFEVTTGWAINDKSSWQKATRIN